MYDIFTFRQYAEKLNVYESEIEKTLYQSRKQFENDIFEIMYESKNKLETEEACFLIEVGDDYLFLKNLFYPKVKHPERFLNLVEEDFSKNGFIITRETKTFGDHKHKPIKVEYWVISWKELDL